MNRESLMKDWAIFSGMQALLFDFDGVLVESVDIKTQAFASLFAPYGDAIVKEVIDYHLKNGGVSRYVKFRYYLENIIMEPVSDEKLRDLGERFSQMVVEHVISAPYVCGAEKMLESVYLHVPLFIVSGTPRDELENIVAQRGMGKYFKQVLGTPVKKGVHVKDILKSYGYDRRRVLFIGDATADYEAAHEGGVNFLGRVPEGDSNPFPAHVRIFKNFSELNKGEDCDQPVSPNS